MHKKDLYGAHKSASVSNRIKQGGFKMLFKHGKTLSADCKLFHIFRPEVEKLLSPNRVFVPGNDTGSDVSRAKMTVSERY